MLTFNLRILLTLDVIATVKRDLAELFPDVKSSHLTEAIARGFGFASHASLRAALNQSKQLLSDADGLQFSTFLKDRGHDTKAVFFWRAAARSAISEVMAREPHLSRWGYYVGRPKRKDDGKMETPTEHHARFLAERESLRSDVAVEEFLRGLVLVGQHAPTRTINPRSGSYGLKHRAEKLACTYPDGTRLGPTYVANGSLIIAAVHAGFSYKTHLDELGYEGVNVTFNMSQTSLDDTLYRFLGSWGLTEKRAKMAAKRVQRGDLGAAPPSRL